MATHLGKVNEYLHSLVGAHVSDVTEVGRGRDETGLAIGPTTDRQRILQHSRQHELCLQRQRPGL